MILATQSTLWVIEAPSYFTCLSLLCGKPGGLILISGYHPQANRKAERANQEVGRFLHFYSAENQGELVRFLPWADYGQNSLWHMATQLTLFQCILGYQSPLFPWNSIPTEKEQVWGQAHWQLELVAHHSKQFADRRRGETPIYNPRDQVCLATKDLRCKVSYSMYQQHYLPNITYHLSISRMT